jgi:preprotein translocase subunit SecB
MNVKKISSSFQLLDTIVTELNIKNEIAQIGRCDIRQANKFDVDYGIESIEQNEDAFFGSVFVTVRFVIKDGKKTDLDLFVREVGYFGGSAKVFSEEDFKKALTINGVASLISVVRSTIMTITNQIFTSGNVKIPLLNVMQLNELKEHASNNKNPAE